MQPTTDVFGARSVLETRAGRVVVYRLDRLAKQGLADLDRLPFTVKILLENLLRRHDGRVVTERDVRALAQWDPQAPGSRELPFFPSRVVLQDFTGVPAVVDLAALRSAVARWGGDPLRINPLVPADLIIDHSVQVDVFGSSAAFAINVRKEYERNAERYGLLRWAQKAFDGFRVVPPGTGIVHQVNLEYLATVVATRGEDGEAVALPDTLVGTDSHTTMVNGLGVLGWGVGGIEAEAVLLGQPLYLLPPQVVGFRLRGALPEGATATDLVLTVTQMLRAHGVVDKFVEFAGEGLGHLSLADRATLSNMAPEYGATAALFPVDDETLRYLRQTGRSEELVDLVERYTKEQGLFRTERALEPRFSELLELDLATVEPSLAGPKRPQDRVPLSQMRESFRAAFLGGSPPPQPSPARGEGEPSMGEGESTPSPQPSPARGEGGAERQPGGGDGRSVRVQVDGQEARIGDGSVVIAAITSCTNTSNPTVMLGAGLLARKAVERGLQTQPWVKTSLAPGSQVVTDYLQQSGLMPYLEALRFHLVGYGCTTCIGNSGPLPEPVAEAVDRDQLAVAAVLSGNRNFEGRIHPQVRAAYLASPPLVVAYALAGTVDIDLTRDPIGSDRDGRPVYLSEIWPSSEEVRAVTDQFVKRDMFEETYGRVFSGDSEWQGLPVPEGAQYAWDRDSTYVREPLFFENLTPELSALADIRGARVLAVLGDSITTDHISPAGAIAADSPAGQYLIEHGVQPAAFNSFGARRGNHEVMVRGTFGNVRLRNELTPTREGDWTVHLPDGEEMRIFEASQRYLGEGTPLLVIAGKEYGSGSSRDWAAKGPQLLGVRAVLAESYERIHRSNLVGMGVLPLQFKAGQNRSTLGLTGRETYHVLGLSDALQPGQELTIRARREDGMEVSFAVVARVDSVVEVDYLRHGGILPMVLRELRVKSEE